MQSLVPFRRPFLGEPVPSFEVSADVIAEHPAWTDPASGQLFRDMRTAYGGTRGQIAAHLATTADVVQALESGRLRALPPWPITQRIVIAYGRLLELDMGPALSRIRQQTQATDRAVPDHERRCALSPPALAPPLMRALPPSRAAHSADRRARCVRRARYAAPVLLLASLVFVPRVPSAIVEAGFSTIAAGIAVAVPRSAVMPADALVWIDVADPQSRKSDKLRLDPR